MKVALKNIRNVEGNEIYALRGYAVSRSSLLPLFLHCCSCHSRAKTFTNDISSHADSN